MKRALNVRFQKLLKLGRYSHQTTKPPSMLHVSDFFPTMVPNSSTINDIPSPFALIVLNQQLPRLTPHLWNKARLRICADGGANRLFNELPALLRADDEEGVRQRYIPEYIVGDLDSVDKDVKKFYSLKDTVIVNKSSDQDTTDFHKCVSYIKDNFGKEKLKVIVLGAFGGRFAHEIANLNVLHSFPNIRMVLVNDKNLALLLPRHHSHEIVINSVFEGPHCGIIPIHGPSTSTTTTGLRWNLSKTALAFGSLISTSNMLEGERVTITSDADLLWTTELKGFEMVEMETDGNSAGETGHLVLSLDPSLISSRIDDSDPDPQMYPPEGEQLFTAEEFIISIIQVGMETRGIDASLRILRRQLTGFYVALDSEISSVAWEQLDAPMSELHALRSRISLARGLLTQEIRQLDTIIRRAASGELMN